MIPIPDLLKTLMGKARMVQTLLFLIIILILITTSVRRAYYPTIVLLNPATGIADVVEASRSEDSFHTLLESGFKMVAAIATASWPYELDNGKGYLSAEILNQFFSPNAAEYVVNARAKLGVHSEFGSIRLFYNTSRPTQIKRQGGDLRFLGLFSQVIVDNGEEWIRTFEVTAIGNVTPVSPANPYSIKINQIRITEITPEKPSKE